MWNKLFNMKTVCRFNNLCYSIVGADQWPHAIMTMMEMMMTMDKYGWQFSLMRTRHSAILNVGMEQAAGY